MTGRPTIRRMSSTLGSRPSGNSLGLTVHSLHPKNTGACAARNAGLRASHGEYIQFLDSDDLLQEERLTRVVEVFRRTSCSYVYTGFAGFCGVCGQTFHTHIPRSTGGGHPFEMLLLGWRQR